MSAAAFDSGQYAPLSAVRNLTSPPCCGRQVLLANTLKLDHNAKSEVLQNVPNLLVRQPSMEFKTLYCRNMQNLLAGDRNAMQLLQFGTSCP